MKGKVRLRKYEKNKVHVSVIIPAHNEEKYVKISTWSHKCMHLYNLHVEACVYGSTYTWTDANWNN